MVNGAKCNPVPYILINIYNQMFCCDKPWPSVRHTGLLCRSRLRLTWDRASRVHTHTHRWLHSCPRADGPPPQHLSPSTSHTVKMRHRRLGTSDSFMRESTPLGHRTTARGSILPGCKPHPSKRMYPRRAERPGSHCGFSSASSSSPHRLFPLPFPSSLVSPSGASRGTPSSRKPAWSLPLSLQHWYSCPGTSSLPFPCRDP